VEDTATEVVCCAPLGVPVLAEEEAQATATLFRALADPGRVRIVNMLATSPGAVCVCDFVAPLGLAQPTVSHHLKILREAGLVTREQRGRWAYYALDTDALRRLREVMDLEGVPA
jgi:ArsR family transcriptional regulator, arsenate/arsenite/antimonite-responsive transcriptional repressor